MARYKVKGPDGAIHVFEGPDDATPEQITAFAAQTFGSAAKAPEQPAVKSSTLSNGADDPGVIGSLIIGAGKTTDSILDGITQLYLGNDERSQAALKAKVDEKNRAYRPLQEARPVATAIGEAVPSMVVPVGGGATLMGNVGRFALAGGLPGALEYGTAEERAGRAAGGAAAGVVGGVVAPKVISAGVKAVPAIGRTARAVVEPLTAKGREAIAGRTLNNAAGDTASATAQRLAGAAELIPGSVPTVGQVAENGGLAALERSIAATNPEAFTQRGMEQAAARTSALRSIAQDEPARAAAVQARKVATDPLYAQAKSATYKMDQRMERLLSTPVMQKALTRAETVAANDGRSFAFDVTPSTPFSGVGGYTGGGSRQITGQGLQDLKMAVDEMLTDPTTGLTGKAGDQVRALRGQLLNWMEDANPAFKAARTTFADMSKPINQMEIGSELLERLMPALSDYGALGKETAAKYALALRNAPATAKNATKFPGAKLEDIMTPQQMTLLNNVARDLARKSNAQELGRGVGSDTVQKLAMSNIAERSGAPGIVGGALNLPGVNKLAKFMYAGPDEEIQQLIAQALLDPKRAATLMQANPAMPAGQTTRQMLLSNPSRTAQITGGATGLALGNLFAQ